ncbi:alkyl sulfatase dimerization domain-containing protein [Caballeronia sordidicola]|uniref:alkyl sulfatase dimerization domain-containing protein n=1 Tax=Caballeronia sordidicola TaxID=196367 RepID=UPI00211B6134|nr:alkyl sulfatase dimerization domain-containing protein [Caballeronia sordidicola]
MTSQRRSSWRRNPKRRRNSASGLFDSVPANLYRLPPVGNRKRYVEFMGGSANVPHTAMHKYLITK